MSDRPSGQQNPGPEGTVDGRVRVAVIFGGTSSEHGVSCLTAAGVLGALDPERYEVLGVGITPSGRWVLVEPDDLARLQVRDGRLPELVHTHPHETVAEAVQILKEYGVSQMPVVRAEPPIVAAEVIISASPAKAIWRGYWEA